MDEKRILTFTNPATGEIFGEIPMSTTEDIVMAQAELKQAAPAWAAKTVSERVRILRKFQKVMIDSVDEISIVMNQDCGKTRQDAMIEVFMTVDMLDQYRKHAERWLRPRPVQRGLYLLKNCRVEYKPYGVVAVIAPWNYPFALAMPPAISALLTGNTVMIKPSEVTGATGVMMEKLFRRVPELAPYVRVLHGDGAVGAAVVQSGPDYIFLTSSTPTGKAVMRSAADSLIPVACELGGKDAMVVLEDADIPKAARWGVWGATFNTGQTCMGVERVYVVEPVYDEFVRMSVEEARKVHMGYSPDTDTSVYMGPITDPRQIVTIRRHLDDAVTKGARILTGGKIDGMYVEPTVLVDVTHDMLIMKEESFGPFMPIVKVPDEETAIRMANDSLYGLGASVWSRDIERANRVARRMEAASVVINDTISQFGVPMLPFGGIKQSGYGRIHGKEGMMQFTRPYAYAVGNAPATWDVATMMRNPGNYHNGVKLMKLAFGVGLEQRLEPVREVLENSGIRSMPRKTAIGLGLGLLGAAGALTLALGRGRKQR